MRVSLNWITSLLGVDDLGLSTEELVRRLTLHLAEIDGIEQTGPSWDGVVIGKVRHREQHPDADRLSCCMVDIGQGEELPIVCGAPNVAAGQTVAVATIGATLSMPDKHGEQQSITIKKGKLRGQPSHGMICAEDELGISKAHDGIMVLDERFVTGTPLREALAAGDTVLEVDNHNINHRPDLWGHLGWAREVAAILGLPTPAAPDTSWDEQAGNWQVRIDAPERCFCYCGAELTGVSNQISPEWMQARLEACGVRPLGLLVDVTNYVMLELGEPMHAFDRGQIASNTIVVRAAQQQESFTTLDDKTHQLDSDDLLIADETRALALAGIMGGQNSAVSDTTNHIVLEAACFQAGGIRRSRIRTGGASESSSRFEKGLYPELCPAAINRAITLLRECCPELHVQARFHAGSLGSQQPSISLPVGACDRLLGIPVPASRQAELLQGLGCQVTDEQVRIPWWRRKDLEQTPDLVEEVGRLHGYDQIPAEPPRLPMVAPNPNPLRAAEHEARKILSAQGWDEVLTYGFTSETWAQSLAWSEATIIRLAHPLSQDQTVLRQSLLPNLVQALAENRKHLDQTAIYEVGKIYGQGLGAGNCVDERQQIAGCCSAHDDQTPFYAARDAALAILTGLGHPARIEVESTVPVWGLSGRCARILVGKQVVGLITELPGSVRQLARLQDAGAFFSIELEQLIAKQATPAPVPFRPVSRYQPVQREFTWVCPENQTWAELEQVTSQAAGQLGRSVDLVTIYRGEPIETGKKAISLRVTLQADDHTLSEKELGKLQDKIIKQVQKRTSASLRA
jgi:phenylalanyl-tRNA synthetase beta chain